MSCAGAADVICAGHGVGAVGSASGTPSRQDAPYQSLPSFVPGK
jgi:hypothetical protein